MLTFIATFSLIFLSEMGDKTQFIAMICSAKYGWKKVMTAIVIAPLCQVLDTYFFQISNPFSTSILTATPDFSRDY